MQSNFLQQTGRGARTNIWAMRNTRERESKARIQQNSNEFELITVHFLSVCLFVSEQPLSFLNCQPFQTFLGSSPSDPDFKLMLRMPTAGLNLCPDILVTRPGHGPGLRGSRVGCPSPSPLSILFGARCPWRHGPPGPMRSLSCEAWTERPAIRLTDQWPAGLTRPGHGAFPC